jgi:Tfp pilus assembly protein PilW
MALAEMMMAMGLGSLVIVAAMALTFYGSRTFATMANYVELDRTSRLALDQMMSDIRQADCLTSFSTNQLVFQTTDPNSGAVSSLTYTYSPGDQTVSRTFNGKTTVLLKGCQLWQPGMYQRNTVTNSFDQYVVDDTGRPDLCKAVKLTWSCSRTVPGLPMNTENVQSTKVVIRKQ